MKKSILVLATSLCLAIFLLTSCGSTSNSESNKESSNGISNKASIYVDEWKAKVIESCFDNSFTYKTETLILEKNGNGKLISGNKTLSGTWKYYEEDNQIVLKVEKSDIGITFDIKTDGDKTILCYDEDVFYRASEYKD